MNNQLIIYYSIGIATIFGMASVAYWLSFRFQKSIPQRILYILIGLSAYIFIAQYLKLQSLHVYADLSHWVQVVKSITISWIPASLNAEFIFPGTNNFFSIHFTPFIYLFAPVFRVFPFPETLLLLQGIFMFSASIPLYLLARKMRGSRLFALLVVTLFLWYPTFQYITLYEFEILRLSIPILLWMIYFWEQKRLPLYFLFIFFAILVREEVGLTIGMFGIYIFFIEKKKILGIITSTFGITSFFIILKLIIPHFNAIAKTSYLSFSLFEKFGNTPFEIVHSILTQPASLFNTILNPIKIANIGMLFIPLLLIPLFSPTVLISILATLGTGLMSSEREHTSYMLYYIAPSVPFIVYAFIKAWPNVIRWLERNLKPHGGVECIHNALMVAVLTGTLTANVFFGPSPISIQFWSTTVRPAPFRTQNFHWSAYRITSHEKKVADFVPLIPDNAIVSTEQFLTTPLFNKKGTMVFPQLESVDGKYKSDYVFIDKTNSIKTGTMTVPGSWDGLRKNPQFYYDWIEKDTQHWNLIKAEDGYELYKRKE